MSDNDDATIGRILTRRQAMVAAGRAGLAIGLASAISRRSARAVITTTRPTVLVAAPRMTEGPFFVDERLNRSDLTAGTTREAVVHGRPLALTVAVYKLADGQAMPLPGATVDVWHADAHGVYSDENQPTNHERTGGQRWLRGYQVTDAAGKVAFRTIFPGWYDGRAPHVHFKVLQFAAAPTTRPTAVTAEFTSQWFFDDAVATAVYTRPPYRAGHRDTFNCDDDIYGEPLADGSPAGRQMTLALAADPGRGGDRTSFDLYLTE